MDGFTHLKPQADSEAVLCGAAAKDVLCFWVELRQPLAANTCQECRRAHTSATALLAQMKLACPSRWTGLVCAKASEVRAEMGRLVEAKAPAKEIARARAGLQWWMERVMGRDAERAPARQEAQAQ